MTESKREELKAWISRLECDESSWANYEKLAVLYAIRDGQTGAMELDALPTAPVARYSSAAAPAVGSYGDSDFLKAVEGKDPARAWAIMDELMETLHVVNERVYNSVLQKVKKLSF